MPAKEARLPTLINTPLQRGVRGLTASRNRFNGFRDVPETVETVPGSSRLAGTPLKRGVN
jgi:hypothetical protein